MIEEGTQSSHRYGKSSNKYMNDYDENKESSYLVYVDVNNLYGWAIRQNQPVDSFKCRTHKEHKTRIRAWSKTKKVHKAVAFRQEAWLKTYIDMNTELRKEAKMTLKKTFTN